MARRLDIHHYARIIEQSIAHVHESTISERNKTLILRYRETCMIKGVCGKVRLIRIVGTLVTLGQRLGKDFDQATKEDLENLIAGLLARDPPYSPETIKTYKAILRGFMTWVVQPDQFPTKNPPPIVAWITTTVRARERKRLDRNELLTPAEIERVLSVCHNTRDRALIAVLWDTGGRIAEVGNLQLKHVMKHEHGYTLAIDGKTGERSPLVITGAPLLAQWLANHPFKDDPEAPLWVHYQYKQAPTHVQYGTISTMLKRLVARAGIQKRVYPHLFRHSRSTFVLATGIMNEAQAKCHFGWTPDSRMLSTYAHLIHDDANQALLRHHHLTTSTQPDHDKTPRTCPRCNTKNPPTATYCVQCTSILDLKRAYNEQDQDEALLALLAQLVIEKGATQEALTRIHNAGLGGALQHLAAQHTSKQATAAPPQRIAQHPTTERA